MKVCRIEKALVLGLLLSTNVYGVSMAEDLTYSEFVALADGEKNITIADSTNVVGENTSSSLSGYQVTVTNGADVTFTNIAGNNVNIKGDGDITIKQDKNNGNYIFDGGIYINGTVEANSLTIDTLNTTDTKGIYTYGGDVNLDVNTLTVKAKDDGIYTSGDASSDVNILTANTVDITSKNGYAIMNNAQEGQSNNVYMILDKQDIDSAQHIANGSSIHLTTESTSRGAVLNNTAYGTVVLSANKIELDAEKSIGIMNGHGTVTVDSMTDNKITAKNGIYGRASNTIFGIQIPQDGDGIADVSAGNDNIINATEKAVWATLGNINVTAGHDNTFTAGDTGLYAGNTGVINLKATNNNTIYSDKYGVYATKYSSSDTEGTINVDGVNTLIYAKDAAVKVDQGAHVNINAEKTEEEYGVNQFYTGIRNEENGIYDGSGLAVDVDNADLDLTKNNGNDYRGAVKAVGTSTVTVGGNGDTSIYSAAIIDGAGGLAGKETTTDSTGTETTTGMDVVSALYAEEGAQINLSGTNTIQTYYADPTDKHTSERVVWAYKGAKIDIDGETHIKTYNYDESPNSGDIAIAAGTATDLKDEDFTEDKLNSLEKATVHLNYKAGSSIEGDILAAYGGEVHISNAAMKAKAAGEEASFDGINIHGNLLAGNTGVLNVNLGNGGRLEGRADDYGDAGTVENSGHATANEEGVTFFDPAFSSKILTGGTVNLTMGSDSTWEVTGQSWITSVNTLGSENVVIDLTSAKSDLNKKARALTIGEMKGDAVFSMRLDGDRSASDMLYIKNADNGKYFINLENPVTVEDMYNGFDGLRFATVGKGSHATFSAGTYGNGVYNVEYEVGTDDYATSTENNAYNSTANDGQMDAAKPGNDLVDNLFKDEPQEAAANGIMTLAAVASPEATDSSDTTEDMGTNTGMNGEVLSDTTNFKLIDVKSTELSNAGKTIIDMSKVNYSNAIYMDRLNKRMGEARYIDGDEGLWVRIRHDRIGKSDAFRSKNTMMELGYDKRVDDREDGEHRRGFAIDYMRGTTDYHNVAGDGDVRRGGVWFYDTWLGNKGHYSDYVLKFGRLSNDFDIYSELGEKITGDYSNFVYSASAEYGRKKDIGKDWYFEPQVQLQYAHVTDADYTTSQGTSVELDAIDSLIGRIGFRLGKDMGENNTFYVKADVLHEFLGDQDISAFDATGRLDTTYENEGTWYDVGLGFSHQFSKGTYMFLDVEKTFGNDNEDTYQFNVGMNWKV